MSRTPGFHIIRRALRDAVGERFPRREFLKRTALLGIAALPIPLSVPMGARGPVVILGGGLAGLSAAYRLSRGGVPCAVYEAQGRLGGRVRTLRNFTSEGMFCELGAELVDSTHTELLGLAAELGVAIDDLRSGEQGLHGQHFYFGGQHYYENEMKQATAAIAPRLAADIARAFADPNTREVNYKSHTPYAVAVDRISLAEYLHALNDGAPWMINAIETAFVSEFGADSSSQSALNLLTLITPEPANFSLYGDSDEILRIREGSSSLVEALASRVEAQTPVHLDHRLVHIEEHAGGLRLTFKVGSGTKVVDAGRVICTLPFSVLREVDGVSKLSLDPVKKRCIRELGYGVNSKQMVAYRSQFWRVGEGACSGYTFTDLPAQVFWDTSHGQSGAGGILTCFRGGRENALAGAAGLPGFLGDVEKIYPGSRKLYASKQAFMRWEIQPFARGSYACPAPGQYTSIMGSAGLPELGGRLLFAGEHVSYQSQGYMNGAVETGFAAADSILGVARSTAGQGVG